MYETTVQGAHIRTGQIYDWLVQFCLFCFLPGWPNQARPKFSGPSNYGKKRVLARPYIRVIFSTL